MGREACGEDAVILDLDGARIALKDGGVQIERPVTIAGDVEISGDVKVGGALSASGLEDTSGES